MPETLVIDASPLIFLGNGGQLDLLQASGASRFIAPPAVLDEVLSSGHTDRAAQAVAGAKSRKQRKQLEADLAHVV